LAAAREPVDVSVLVPALNEERSLAELVGRIEAAMADRYTYELLVILDGGFDGSLELLLGLRRGRPWLRVIELARTIGQHPALRVGLTLARGQCLVTLDADLQNPPEAVPLVIERLLAGAEAVGTIRSRRQDPLHRSLASGLFVNLLALLPGSHRMSDPGCMLRGWSRRAVEAFLAEGVAALYLPLQLNRHARTYEEFETAHAARQAGASRYSAAKLARLLGKALATQVPLRLLPAPPAVELTLHGFPS
jgi:undecaprenyl-phosphate 4-deoxy-4-formamido-L-arabinose transferase